MSAWQASVVPALGWALVDFLWQGLVVGLLAWLGLALTRNARPQARYALLLAALGACVALPCLGVLRAVFADTSDLAGSTMQRWLAVGNAVVATDSPTGTWRDGLQARMPQLVVAWSFGASLLGLRFALGLAWVGRLRGAGTLPGFDWQVRLERLAAAVGLARPPLMRLVDALDGPVVAGWWRPVVLMPAALLARMPADLVEALLAHELAHVRRHDYLVNLLQGVVEALLFYHPVVWWLSHRVRIEREEIADDLASRAIGQPRRLALALQQLDLWQADAAHRGTGHSHLAPAAHGGQLMNRIRRLIQPRSTGLHWKSGLPLLAVGTLCAAVYAQAMPARDAAAPVASESQDAAAPAGGGKWSAERGQPYALVRDGQERLMLSGNDADEREVRQARRQVAGDFLWFRRDGTGYVVQDPALVAEVRKAWAPADAVGAKLDALGEQMKPHARKMDALGKQMEGMVEADRPQHERMQAASERMRPLAEQQHRLGEQMRVLGDRMADARDEAERDQLSRQMEALSAQMAPLNAQMSAIGAELGQQGADLQRARAPMQQLGEQMREAGEPMQALGKKMEVLGKEVERLAHQADAQAQQVIERALREGKAAPVGRQSAQ